MRLVIHVAFLSSVFAYSGHVWADTAPPFTREQLEYIRHLLDEERAKARQEIFAELESRGIASSAPLPTVNIPNHTESPVVVSQETKDVERQFYFDSNAGINDVLVERSSKNTPGVQLPTIAAGVPPAAFYYDEAAPATREIQAPKTSIEVQSSTQGSQATLLVSRGVNHALIGNVLSASNVTFQATTPFDDQKNNRANFATLDGLATGLSVKLGMGWTWAHEKSDPAPPDITAFEKLLQAPKCHTNDECDAIAKQWASLLPKVFAWGKAAEIHLGGSRNEFDYYNPAFEKVSDFRHGWLLGGSLATYNPERTQFYGAGFDFVRGYAAGKERIICPSNVSPPLECLQGRFAPPSNDTSRLLYAETRQFWKVPFSIRVTRDLAHDDTGVDIPIYFAQNKDKKFDGGFRVGWTNTDHFQAGIFVGTSFDIPDY